MKFLAILSALMVLVLAASTTASAASPMGTTTLLGTPTSGLALDVDVSVVSDIPVVPYEYSIQNECFFSGKATGRPDSFQQDPIVNWNYSSDNGTVPHAIMTVYLNSVPAGSACKVFLVKNNTVVKGSTTTYTVQ